MKFGFVTCVQLGLSCIEKIYDIGGKLEVLITLHDHKGKKKSGRIYLDDFSSRHSIPLIKINHVNDDEVINAIKQYDLDWLFIIGWSQIASVKLINSPKKGCIGMHPTLLPEGRGRAAIPWAIIKELDITGVTMFVLDEGVDTGPVLGQHTIPLEKDETATTLYHKVNLAHELLIANVFPKLNDGYYQLIVQDETKATYWAGRMPGDGELFHDMTISEADRLIRATTKPYPGAFYMQDTHKIIIWSARICKDRPINYKGLLFAFKDGFALPLEYDIIKISE